MISVIIPAYKNTDLLLKNLKHNLPHLKNCEIIIVNDDPEKSIKKDLEPYPVVLIENKENLGFGGTANKGVEQAKSPYVMLLNSDVILSDSSFKQCGDHFKKDNSLFAVTFAQQEKDGTIVGKNKFFFKRGLFFHKKADDLRFGQNAWAEGGTSLFDRNKFLELGGFDTIYKPFYWEDIDLSYRAKKHGYLVLFDPKIQVTHYHESTIGKYFSKKYVKEIAYRNQFIFIWKNITAPLLVFSHLIFFIPNLLYYALKNEPDYIKGYFDALKLFGEIMKKRAAQKKYHLQTDSEILSNVHE